MTVQIKRNIFVIKVKTVRSEISMETGARAAGFCFEDFAMLQVKKKMIACSYCANLHIFHFR